MYCGYSTDGGFEASLPVAYQSNAFVVCLDAEHYVVIRGATRQATIECLYFVLGVPDNHYKHIALDQPTRCVRIPSCPLRGVHLRNALSINLNREFGFNDMHFTAEQGRILSRNYAANTRLRNCQFLDGGASYVEELAFDRERGEQAVAPTTFTIIGTLAFAPETFRQLGTMPPKDPLSHLNAFRMRYTLRL